MKKIVVFLFLALAIGASAQQKKQSLKDLLYGGKLKSDSNTVVRSSEDLSTKIDTSTRKPAAPETPVITGKPSATIPPIAGPPARLPATGTEVSDAPPATTADAKPAVVKSNTKLLKEYTDSLISGLKTDVLSNKKIKKDTYYVIAEYEIGTDGTVTVGNVTSSPENPLLQSEVKTRMELNFPKLAPAVDGAGNPRKLKRKHSFTITKD